MGTADVIVSNSGELEGCGYGQAPMVLINMILPHLT
jgi:hypothetical protein